MSIFYSLGLAATRFLKALLWLHYSGFTLIFLFCRFITVGARVFARYTNGKYYRGFVDSVTSSTVHIEYDDGSTIELKMSDPSAVILEELPCYTNVDPGQRVIAHWPGKSRYYSATVKSKMSRGSNACYQEDAYNVVFDDGDKITEDFNQIRLIPS